MARLLPIPSTKYGTGWGQAGSSPALGSSWDRVKIPNSACGQALSTQSWAQLSVRKQDSSSLLLLRWACPLQGRAGDSSGCQLSPGLTLERAQGQHPHRVVPAGMAGNGGERSGGKAWDGHKEGKGWNERKIGSRSFQLLHLNPATLQNGGSCIHSDGNIYLCHFPPAKVLWIIFQTHAIFHCCSVTDLNKPFPAVCQTQRKRANECLEDESPSGSHLTAPHCYRLVTTSHTVERKRKWWIY